VRVQSYTLMSYEQAKLYGLATVRCKEVASQNLSLVPLYLIQTDVSSRQQDEDRQGGHRG